MLKKPREIQPATPPPPTAIGQIMNADKAAAEGAARAHARSGGDASTLIGRIIDHGTTVKSAASNILKKGVKSAIMASAAAAATAPKASTTKGMDLAAPKPPIVTAKAAPAKPKPTPAPPSEQPVTAVTAAVTAARPRAKAIAKTVPPPAPIDIPEAPVTSIAVSRGARRKREDVQLRKEEQQQKRPRPAPVMGGGLVRRRATIKTEKPSGWRQNHGYGRRLLNQLQQQSKTHAKPKTPQRLGRAQMPGGDIKKQKKKGNTKPYKLTVAE
jgi:hypothetical protein